MQRRKHKKSRHGCIGCKKRHVKCDETRPRCVQCRLSSRECIYAGPTPSVSSQQLLSRNQDSSEDRTDRLSKRPLFVSSSCSTSQDGFGDKRQRTSATMDRSIAYSKPTSSETVAGVNVLHIALFHHATNSLLPEIARDHFYPQSLVPKIIELALSHCFLLHELLSFSALHLRELNPDRSQFYDEQAVELQASALSLFNQEAMNEFRGSAHAAAFMFSSFTGKHVLATVLLDSKEITFERMIEGFVKFVRLQVGIKTVIRLDWSSLHDSSLQPIFTGFQERRDRNRHKPPLFQCDTIFAMINSARLDPGGKAEYNEVVGHLLDCIRYDPDDLLDSVFAWPTLLPLSFAEDLLDHRPEALVILAHYGVLIHYNRDYWSIGVGGRVLIELISRRLGPRWQPYLAFPWSQIETPAGGT